MDKKLDIPYHEYDDVLQLAEEDRELLHRAGEMVGKAYAPYSGFRVGAALRLEDGTIVTGSNQENAAYPSGLCAERVAVFAAAANYPDKAIESLAITADARQKVDHPVAPCGACRQAILEYEHKFKHPVRLILRGATGKIVILDSVRSLLPFQFTKDDMGLCPPRDMMDET